MKHGRRFLTSALVLIALAVALALLSPWGQDWAEANGTVHYVDADATAGGNNGSSWGDAFTELQPALDAALAGDQIWVAAGTYTPTWEFSPGDSRSATFQMKNGVAIYGGFDPSVGNTEWEDRDWEGNPTILSGDLDGDDGPDFANNDENSYHVFFHPDGTGLDATAILDGFTVTGGNANIEPSGGPHIQGGGMYNSSSSPALTNCAFLDNSADNNGGGMYDFYESSPALTNCTFSGNSADDDGGGMYNGYFSSPTLTDCTFSDNSAEDHGGGILNDRSSSVLTNCTFSGNSAFFGCGMYNYASSPTLTDCSFVDNLGGAAGGGMYNTENSSPTLTNCTFSGNSVASWGGGMRNYSSSPTLTNCTFSSNSAGINGGGLHNEWNSSPTLTNCTFSGNSAGSYGGGMYSSGSSSVLTDCILWGDTPQEIYNTDSTSEVTYNDILGGHPGEGNMSADPLFVDPDNGDFHLELGSPCIDAGNNEAPELPGLDFDREPRILDGDDDGIAMVDMGVDEVAVGWPHSRVYLPLVLRAY